MEQRLRRVNEVVREIVAELLPDLKDPRIGFVTVTDVRTTADLSSAEVFFTVLPDTAEARAETAAGLRSATPVIRREVGAQLRTRRTPDLHFVHDPLPEQGRRIDTLLKNAAQPEEDDVTDAGR
ncbi:MAG: 30S ribosome-binding factor RbfA [Nitriliruptorales bacterium]|nr:30S ribosome-binding factor RbfA [Nitriliruptorales bacterium]